MCLLLWESLDSYLLQAALGVHFEVKRSSSLSSKRILVDDPTALLDVSDVVLIEGPPGSGKTIFMKYLAATLLEAGAPVAFLSCSEIPRSAGRQTFQEILRNYYLGNAEVSQEKDGIIVIDALDEGSIDLYDKIEWDSVKSKNVIF